MILPVLPLLAAVLVSSMSIGAVFALLAALQDAYGFADWGLGLVSGSAFVASLVAQLSLSRYADRGHARTLLRGGLVLGAAGTLGFGLGRNLPELVIARVCLGLAAGMVFPATRRVFIARFPGREGEALGWLLTVDVAGFVLGPLVAAVIAQGFGLRVPFVVLAAVLLALLPAVARVEQPPAGPSERRAMRALLVLPEVRVGVYLTAALFVAVGAFDTIWARYLTDRGATTTLIAVTLAGFALPLVLLPGLAGRFGDRVGARRAGVIASGLTVPCLLGYGFTRSIAVACSIAVVNSVFDAMTAPSSQAVIARGAPPNLAAAGQGLAGAAEAGAGAVAAFATGPLYGWGGASAAWSAVAVCCALLTGAAALTRGGVK